MSGFAAPTAPSVNQLWVDNTTTPPTKRQWSGSGWVSLGFVKPVLMLWFFDSDYWIKVFPIDHPDLEMAIKANGHHSQSSETNPDVEAWLDMQDLDDGWKLFQWRSAETLPEIMISSRFLLSIVHGY